VGKREADTRNPHLAQGTPIRFRGNHSGAEEKEFTMPVNKMLESDNNQPQEAELAKTPDPFDPKQLRLSQDFSATLGVKKAILTIPRRRPSKETWIRVHPKEEYRIQTGILELKEEQAHGSLKF
jgi:hypothetical protein